MIVYDGVVEAVFLETKDDTLSVRAWWWPLGVCFLPSTNQPTTHQLVLFG